MVFKGAHDGQLGEFFYRAYQVGGLHGMELIGEPGSRAIGGRQSKSRV